MLFTRVADLPVTIPFDGAAMLAFLSWGAVPGVEIVAGGSYFRSVRLPAGPGILAVELGRDRARCTVTATVAADLDSGIQLAERLVNVDAPQAAIDAQLAADPHLGPSVAAFPGLRLPRAIDGAEILIRAVIGQQVSLAAARTAGAKLTARFGTPLPPELAASAPGITSEFVAPAGLACLQAEDIGGPRRRAETLLAAARDLTDGALSLDPSTTASALTTLLVARPGLGPWTAGYVALMLLGGGDVLLDGDLVLRQGARALGLPDDPRALAAHGRRWAPYRSTAGFHLWRAAPRIARLLAAN